LDQATQLSSVPRGRL